MEKVAEGRIPAEKRDQLKRTFGSINSPSSPPATTTLHGAQAPASESTSGGQTALPAGKRPAQAKTQPEFDAYKMAAALTDTSALDTAANEFAAKFPTSELRILLYGLPCVVTRQRTMGQNMMEMGRRVLAIDPDDPQALLAVSEVIVERTGNTDVGKDQSFAEALKMAQHSLETIDTDIAIPAGTTRRESTPIRAPSGLLLKP